MPQVPPVIKGKPRSLTQALLELRGTRSRDGHDGHADLETDGFHKGIDAALSLIGYDPKAGDPIFVPHPGFYLIQRDEAPTHYEDGDIEIPEASRTKPPTGTIVAVNPMWPDDLQHKYGTPLPIGTRVVVGKYGGTEIEGPRKGISYAIHSAGEVLGVLIPVPVVGDKTNG